MWLELLNSMLPDDVEFLGIDIDEDILRIAEQKSSHWNRKVSFANVNFEDFDGYNEIDLILAFNIFPYVKDIDKTIDFLYKKINSNGYIAVRQYDGASIRFGPLKHSERILVDSSLYSSLSASNVFLHYDLDRVFSSLRNSKFIVKNMEFEIFSRISPFDKHLKKYLHQTLDWTRLYINKRAQKILYSWEEKFLYNEKINDAYFFEVDLVGLLQK